MDVFGKNTDEPSRPLLPPGTCWVCSNSPQQEAIKVIDTRRNTQAGGSLSHASNRIYICEPCAQQLGEAIGMVSADEAGATDVIAERLAKEVQSLTAELADARTQQTRVVDADAFFAKIEAWNAAQQKANATTASAVVKKPAVKRV